MSAQRQSVSGTGPAPVSTRPAPQVAASAAGADRRHRPAGGGDLAKALAGWRRGVLAATVITACLVLALFIRWLSATPMVDVPLSATPEGGLAIAAGAGGTWAPRAGQRVRGVSTVEPAAPVMLVMDAQVLHRSPRWQPDGSARQSQVDQQARLAELLRHPQLDIVFEDGSRQRVEPQPRGVRGLGLLLLPLTALSLLLVLSGGVLVMAQTRLRSLLYALMCLSLALNLLAVGAETLRGLGPPPGLAASDLMIRLVLDVVAGAAIVQSCALPAWQGRALLFRSLIGWSLLLLGLIALSHMPESVRWWWAQGLCVALALAALGALQRANRLAPHPYGVVMMRFAQMVSGGLLLLTLVVAASSTIPVVGHGIAVASSVAWYLLGAALLLLMPFLARSRQLLREFAMLTAVGTAAATVDLLLVTAFALSNFTALAITLFVSVALYAALRQRVVDKLLGEQVLSTEQVFEQLLVATRELQSHPQRLAQVHGRLLTSLFRPLELSEAAVRGPRAGVARSGGVLTVPAMPGAAGGPGFVLRHAQMGKRLFTKDDARLADRIGEQLRRAIEYDAAVERGRSEERQRIAQDLHDDIGARLLTMMYQARSPELEDYIRRTLQDLKTLTRGLAAAEHHLSDAAAEWKADLQHRAQAARATVDWHCDFDSDPRIGVVAWSSLTRILRELVSNALWHGKATRIVVRLKLHRGRLSLRVADNGQGIEPERWSHGLGLGGVRKRAKALEAQVAWRQNEPHGIVCEICAERFPLAD